MRAMTILFTLILSGCESATSPAGQSAISDTFIQTNMNVYMVGDSVAYSVALDQCSLLSVSYRPAAKALVMRREPPCSISERDQIGVFSYFLSHLAKQDLPVISRLWVNWLDEAMLRKLIELHCVSDQCFTEFDFGNVLDTSRRIIAVSGAQGGYQALRNLFQEYALSLVLVDIDHVRLMPLKVCQEIGSLRQTNMDPKVPVPCLAQVRFDVNG